MEPDGFFNYKKLSKSDSISNFKFRNFFSFNIHKRSVLEEIISHIFPKPRAKNSLVGKFRDIYRDINYKNKLARINKKNDFHTPFFISTFFFLSFSEKIHTLKTIKKIKQRMWI